MAKLSTADRKALPKSSFVFPEKAPGSGSYPIPDEGHARDALSRSSGKPEEGAVSAAVGRKFPDIARQHSLKKLWSDHRSNIAAHNKKWTKKSDDQYDKKQGIREGSPKDKKLDASRGLEEDD